MIAVKSNVRHGWMAVNSGVGLLASHNRSLTHFPSSLGWASRCLVIDCFLLCVCLFIG